MILNNSVSYVKARALYIVIHCYSIHYNVSMLHVFVYMCLLYIRIRVGKSA